MRVFYLIELGRGLGIRILIISFYDFDVGRLGRLF